MRFTYVASDNTAGNAQTLGASGEDILVKKVIFGNPANGKGIKLYNKRVAFGHASGLASTDPDDVAAYILQPATIGAGFNAVVEVDFTANGSGGLPLDGGSFHQDGAKVTVVWEVADASAA